MSTIRNVLQILGYSESKIKAIAKLLLLNNESGLNAFSNFVNLVSKKDIDRRKKDWTKLILAMGISDKVIPTNWIMNTEKIWQNESNIMDVLDFNFSVDNHQLFKFIVALMQLQFILGSRFEIFSGEKNIYENDTKKAISFALIKLIQELGFSTERQYMDEDGEIKSLFLHAATEIALATRMSLLKEVAAKQCNPIKVFYTTNPRGLSKSEASTVEILATWFTSDHELQQKISIHIKELFARKDIQFDWFNGLNKLRGIILESVNEKFGLQLKEFPSAPHNEIYPDIYDQTAVLDGNRDPLNNKWPHIGHLLSHLAVKTQLPLDKISFEVIPVSGTVIDNKYKPAQTKELIDALFNRQTNILENKTIYAISDNSVSYGGIRQDIMLNILAKGLNNSINVITYYDAVNSDQIDFERITKEVAAQLYTHYELDSDIGKKLLAHTNKKEELTI